jgi:hypothetical protein
MANQKPNKRSLSERNVAIACRAGLARMEFIDSKAYEFLPTNARPGHLDAIIIKNFAKTARAFHQESSKLNDPMALQEFEVVAALIQDEALLKHQITLSKTDIRHKLTEFTELTQIIGDAIEFTQKPGPKTDEWLHRLVAFILDEWVRMGLPEPQSDKRSQCAIMIADYLDHNNISKGVTEVTIANAISQWKQVRMNSESE